MSQIYSPGTGGGSGIINVIDGDTGSITGATVTIYADNAANNSGATVAFVNSGTVSTLNVSDSSGNTMLGVSAGNLAESGFGNVAVGAAALQTLSSGNVNVAIGESALDATTSGSQNIGIGQLAGDNFGGTENGNILLNSLGQGGDNYVLRIGNATGTGGQNLNAAFIQGIYSNTQDPGGTVEYVTIDNTSGRMGVTLTGGTTVLFSGDTGTPFSTSSVTIFSNQATNNAGSTVSFNAVTPNLTLNVSDSNFNTIIGLGAGNSTISGAQNTSVGHNSLSALTTGSQNTGLGDFVLEVLTIGTGNVAVGDGALSSSVADGSNTAIGFNCLSGLNGGSGNTAVGWASIGNNSATCNNLTAVGYQSMTNATSAVRCTAVGFNTMMLATTDSDNTALGDQALAAINTGQGNTAVGSSALNQALTGVYNTGLGYLAGANYTGAESYNCCINAQGTVGDASVLRLGDSTGTGVAQFNEAFIQGVYNNSQPVSGTVEIVTIDNTSGQLGVATSVPGLVAFSGDTGTPFTSSSVTIGAFPTTTNGAGESVFFRASGTQLELLTTDGSLNTFIGRSCGVVPNGSSTNTAIGYSSMVACAFGSNNVALGQLTLAALSSGGFNLAAGDSAGINYTSSESYNISLNSLGVTGESNVLRIGSGTGTGQQQLASSYISGIANATISSGSPTPYLTLTDTSSDQIVALAPVDAATASATFGSLVVGTALQNTANYPIHVNVLLQVTAATGGQVFVGVGSTNTPTARAVTPSLTLASVLPYSFSFVVPAKYYALVTTTGTITIGSITTFATQIG